MAHECYWEQRERDKGSCQLGRDEKKGHLQIFSLKIIFLKFEKSELSEIQGRLNFLEQFECKLLPYYFITLEYLMHISYWKGPSTTLLDVNFQVRRLTLIYCCQITLRTHSSFTTTFFVVGRSSSASHFAFSGHIPFIFSNLGRFFRLSLTFISLELLSSRGHFCKMSLSLVFRYCSQLEPKVFMKMLSL